MNLLKETIEILEDNGKTMKDVKWIGCKDFKIPIETFITLADVEYDDGYGGQEVAKDLLVVGEDFWLERHEYDGSEWWEFKKSQKEPEDIKKISKIIGGYWNTLYELNNIDE